MSDENIFDDKQTPPVVEPPKPPVIPDSLKELVGEGKKYASLEKALESIPHKESHIQKLERENKEYKEKLAEAIAIEEVYKKLTESVPPSEVVTPAPAGLDEASVAALFERKLAEKEAERIALANVNRVKDALKDKYGEKAKEVYDTKAEELGVSVSFLNEVVRKSPKAAEELFGIKPKAKAASASTPSVNTAALHNNRPPEVPSAKVVDNSTDALVAAWRAAKPE